MVVLMVALVIVVVQQFVGRIGIKSCDGSLLWKHLSRQILTRSRQLEDVFGGITIDHPFNGSDAQT